MARLSFVDFPSFRRCSVRALPRSCVDERLSQSLRGAIRPGFFGKHEFLFQQCPIRSASGSVHESFHRLLSCTRCDGERESFDRQEKGRSDCCQRQEHLGMVWSRKSTRSSSRYTSFGRSNTSPCRLILISIISESLGNILCEYSKCCVREYYFLE